MIYYGEELKLKLLLQTTEGNLMNLRKIKSIPEKSMTTKLES